MDEALRLGLKVDGPGLQRKLGVQVVPLVASKGRGVKGLFLAGKAAAGTEPDYALRFSAIDDNALTRHRLGLELAAEFVKQGELNLT